MVGTENPRYDLFISYSKTDRAWVKGYFLDALQRAGVHYLTEEAFGLGVPLLREFEHAIQQSRHTLLVLSPAYLAEGLNQFVDLLAQHYGIEVTKWPVIPLILRATPLPSRLALLTSLDATEPTAWPDVIRRLCTELHYPVPVPAPIPPCPYPGMVPFRAEDVRFFYGREVEIRRMLQHLRHQHLLFIIGPSGSGKSSLVFAGLLPRLPKSSYFPQGFWLVRHMRPGGMPMRILAQAIEGDPSQPVKTVANLLAIHPPACRLLLVIDQFEELFTQTKREEHRSFLTVLRALQSIESCAILISMRADFYPDLMTSDLWPVLPSQRLEIAPLRGKELRLAIQCPAEDVGVHFEAGLVERLLADSAEEPGVLPLLQETMVLLWEEMQHRLITLSAYEQLGDEGRGGLDVALVRKADATITELSSAQQDIARRLFLRLIQFGEGRADTRRSRPVAALRSHDESHDLFDQTLAHLTQNRLLTVSGGEAASEKSVDIAHESIISSWPTLRLWLTKYREAEQIRRRLEDKAAEWVRLGRGNGGLLDEIVLLEAENWLNSADATEMGYSEALSALAQASRMAIEATKRERTEILHDKRLSALGRMAAGVAHEIKNPLASVRTFTQLVSRKHHDIQFIEKFDRIVPRELDRINLIVEELLELARPARLHCAPVALPALLQRVVEIYSERLLQQSVRLETDWATFLPPLLADGEQLCRVFANIVLNAIEAMPAGGALTVTCRPVIKPLFDSTAPGLGKALDASQAEAEARALYTNHIEVIIRDTGEGIPEDQLALLFTPFYTTKPRGTGLGLALSHKIIEEHLGSIHVTSKVGQGTEVTVTLPSQLSE